MRAPARVVPMLWTALFLYSVLYVPAFVTLQHSSLLPILGAHGSWVFTAWLLYGVIVAGLALVVWLQSGTRPAGVEPKFGPLVPSRLARRTGIPGTDRFGLVVALTLIPFTVGDEFWFPWVATAAAVFALTVMSPIDQWSLAPGREIPEPPAILPLQPGEATVERSWTWSCRSRPLEGAVSLRIRTGTVAARDRSNPSRSGLLLAQWESVVRRLVEDGATDREAAEAARQLLAFARTHRFNYFEEAQNTLQFVQVIPYAHDQATKGIEYFRYAIETLYDNAGDCDCKAVLAATLFRLMGLRSVVLLSADEEHAAVAVEGAPDFPGNRYFEWGGARYYFCETTDGSFGFTVGEVPPGVDLARYTVRVEIEPALLAAASA